MTGKTFRKITLGVAWLGVLFCATVIITSFVNYFSKNIPPGSYPGPGPRDPCVYWTVYDVGELATGTPAWILKGFAVAESNERDHVIGDKRLGGSRGRFQHLNRYYKSRCDRWGSYDPEYAHDAAIITGRIYQELFHELGTQDLAIAAYRQGAGNVRLEGPSWWYVRRVYRAGGQYAHRSSGSSGRGDSSKK